MSLDKLVPTEANGWKAEGKGSFYDRKTLFNYIDGGAEVYLAYDFREAFVIGLTREGEPSLEVIIFDMGSSQDAYGIFSYELEEDERAIGQGSEYGGGLLRFWKDRFFICVMADKDTPSAQKGAMALGYAVAGAIEGEGKIPEIVKLLPEGDIIPNTTRYFHNSDCLNRLYYVANQNILSLNERTEAVIARCSRNIPPCYVLLIRYQDNNSAETAYKSFLLAYLPEASDGGPLRMENSLWTGAKMKGSYVAIAFDAVTKEKASDLLEKSLEKVEAH